MKKLTPIIIVVLGLIVLGAVLYFVIFSESASEEAVNNGSTSQQSSAADTSTPVDAPSSDAAAQNTGYYVSYADYKAEPGMYNDGKIVYFFNAKWCPTCKALTNDIEQSAAKIPVGVTIISIDYDQYTDLKRQYGVTYQHTLVQVDAEGNQIKKWSGGNTLDSVLQQI